MLDTPQSPNWQLHASFGVKSETVRTEIASGGFATVYAESRDDGQRVVVKEQSVKTEEEGQKIRYEFRMQEKVNRLDTNSSCTVKAVALHEWDTAMLMELEYGGKAVKVDDGKFNDELDLSPTDPQMICQRIMQIGSVLQLSNERGNMLVQDVKLENVLYDGQNFKLIDFGEAIDFNDPPNTVQFEVTPMITTSLQIWLLNLLGEDLYYHSYERVRNEPLFALLRQTPSVVDMQALVISVLDFILRPMKNDERFYVKQRRVGMQNLYRIPQIVANKQQILGEIQQRFVQRPAFAAQLVALLDAYWPEYVPYLPDADGSVVRAAFARSVAKFGDWRKFMVHAQRMCMAA